MDEGWEEVEEVVDAVSEDLEIEVDSVEDVVERVDEEVGVKDVEGEGEGDAEVAAGGFEDTVGDGELEGVGEEESELGAGEGASEEAALR